MSAQIENNIAKNNIKRVVIGITGSTGVIYGVRLLEVLNAIDGIETHLILSPAARQTLAVETSYKVNYLESLANYHYNFNEIGARIASGSFRFHSMVVIPCSMKTLSAIASSYADNLVVRAADVTLKERRRLILLVRETPLHLGHLKLMVQVTENGGIIMPPVPSFYHNPQSVMDIVDHTVQRVVDLLDIELPTELVNRWNGMKAAKERLSEDI